MKIVTYSYYPGKVGEAVVRRSIGADRRRESIGEHYGRRGHVRRRHREDKVRRRLYPPGTTHAQYRVRRPHKAKVLTAMRLFAEQVMPVVRGI